MGERIPAVVVGFGSIGARHAQILEELGCDVAVVSRRESSHRCAYGDLASCIHKFRPEYVVVATRTEEHVHTAEELARAEFCGPVLVEKPLCHSAGELSTFSDLPRLRVGYNLRFHPVLIGLREALVSERVLSATAYCGSYLPGWRPDRDYRTTNSACGGVLRELSHELDYVLWLFGDWHRVGALGSAQPNSLAIEGDESFSLLAECERCPSVTVHVNFIDRIGHRFIIVNTEHHTYRADLMAESLTVDSIEERFPIERSDTYRRQHEAMLQGGMECCTFDEGATVVRFVEAIEEAARNGTWAVNGELEER